MYINNLFLGEGPNADAFFVRPANAQDVPFVARCVVEAMHLTEEEVSMPFVEELCMCDNTLYSYRNAVLAQVNNKLVACLIFYQGEHYAAMREVTFCMIKESMGMDFSHMPLETEAGELYLDSLYVESDYRGRRIGELLFSFAIQKARLCACHKVTLIAEEGYSHLEHYYSSMGFVAESEDEYFGKRMKKMSKSPWHTSPMRKASRAMDADFAIEVFQQAPYTTLSVLRPDGLPYSIPLSIAVKDATTLYFHCAMEGEKITCLNSNPIVHLSAVSECKPVIGPLDKSFTLEYKSAMAWGIAEMVKDEVEKTEALRLLCARFLPNSMDLFEMAVSRSLSRTCVVRITLMNPPTGKRKEYDLEGKEKKWGRR